MKIKTINVDSTDELEEVSVLFDLYRQFYKQETDLKSAKEFLSDRVSKSESVIYAVFDEKTNRGMGFVQLYPAFSSVSLKRLWILNDLYVREEYRKLGVGEALIEKCKVLAIETGSKGLMLETHGLNFNAQKLYDKSGFIKDEQNLRYYFILK